MWDLILDPFVTLLTLMYAMLNNDIVLAIAVLTVIIRMLTYPLLAKQHQSSKRMQEIQPRLKKLQEKYKDDREKLAQAQMALYKEVGVNPLGGCLPAIIQFPIIIGLYQAIIFALAATPFQLVDLSERLLIPGLDGLIPLQNMWLGMDLTQPPTPPLNPEFSLALPALVMVTTWLQFKLSMPAAQNGAAEGAAGQAQAMTRSMGTIMPVMFGLFALSFSVGLSVYFIVSNIVGIIQYSPMGKRVLNRLFRIRDDDKRKNEDADDDDEVETSAKKDDTASSRENTKPGTSASGDGKTKSPGKRTSGRKKSRK